MNSSQTGCSELSRGSITSMDTGKDKKQNTCTGDRTIFHVDVNSAFLSWSALKRLREEPGSVDLRTVPSAVGGDVKTRHGIITAKSIPAKKYGIETGEPVIKALQKCPQLILVPSDFETYRSYSNAFIQILKEVTPDVEQVSIDEAFLDVTDIIGPQDRPGAEKLAQHIRQEVYKRLGFTVNVGISTNKLLAKMASDFAKPDRTHTLYPGEVPEKMWPLPIRDLHGCGRATAGRLNQIGINTIGEAAATDPVVLQNLLGQKTGAYIWNSANGINDSQVRPDKEQAKSVSNEITLPEDLHRDDFREKGIPVIRSLSKKVAGRLKKAGLAGQTVTLQVKTSDFRRFSRQTVLPEATDRERTITEAALALAEHLLTDPGALFDQGHSIRLIGVGVSRLTQEQVHQISLFEWEEETKREEEEQKQNEKQMKLDEMMNQVNQRFGKGAIEKGYARNKEQARMQKDF